MFEVIPFKAEHMGWLKEQKATAYLNAYLTDDHSKALEKLLSYTAVSNGRILICAGVVEYWPGRGEAWAILSENCKEDFLKIHNSVKRFLNTCPIKRVEAAVDVDFEAGHRWVKSLGFELEAPILKAFNPNGGNCSLYARVK